jgi:hypothetical protein
MPPQVKASDIRDCFGLTLKTLDILAGNFNTPFLGVISTTIQSVLENIEVNFPSKQRGIMGNLIFSF